jgi:hypothetical protein
MRSIPAFLSLLHLSGALLALQGCRTGADVETGGGAATASASRPSTPPKTLASEPPAFPDPVVDPSRFQEPLTPQCMLLYTQIQGLDAGIPFVLRDLPKTLDEINTDLKTLIGHCRKFLSDCPDTPATCSAQAILARALMVRNARHREEIEKERRKELVDLGLTPEQISKAWPDVTAGVDKIMEDYFREIESLARGVVGECTKGTAERPSNARHAALRVLMDIYNKRWDYSQVRRIGKQIIEEYPRADAISAIHTAIAESYLHEEKFEEAAEYLREVIAQRFEEPEYVIYNNHLFEALSGMGNLDEMEELAHLMRAEYPTRMSGISSNFLMAQYEQWYYNAAFWIGFTRFAQGDPAGALQAFEESAQEVDALASKLAPEGKHLNKVIEIYRVLRTEDMIYYLKNEHGKVPEVDFDLGRKAASAALPVTASPPLADATAAGGAETDLWSTREKVTLAESRGKVVLVVFRRTRDARSARFLQKMDQLVKERAKDGLVGLTLGFLVGRGTAADDAAALEDQRKELAELGVTLPAGFDPDRERQSIFRTLHATVGTATFLVFNRKGEHAWYLADPRSMDSALAARVIDRILAE